MGFVDVQLHRGIATVVLERGKVNALNPAVVEELSATFNALQSDAEANAVVLTGRGKFFSFGFDVPEFLSYTREEFTNYLASFTTLYRRLFIYPKPLVVALNGHAIAGGCILAAACDHRIMVEGTGRIGVPELAVGVPFPALPLQIMAARLGDAALRDLVYSGRTVTIDEAKPLGLIDEKCPAGMLMDRASEVAEKLASIPSSAFALTKASFYSPILERTNQLADLNARVTNQWLQQDTYDSIRKYLDRTIKK